MFYIALKDDGKAKVKDCGLAFYSKPFYVSVLQLINFDFYQGEAERGWQEAHQQRLEKDRVTAQRESLECTSTIAITTARGEVSHSGITIGIQMGSVIWQNLELLIPPHYALK